MKIAVVDNLPDGGAKKVVYEQIKHLASKHQVWYFTNNLESVYDFEQFAKVQRYNFEVNFLHGSRRFLSDFNLWRHYFRIYKMIEGRVKTLQADWVIFHPCRLTQAPMGLAMNQKNKIYFAHEWCRLIYEPQHHPLPINTLKRGYEKVRRSLIKFIDLKMVQRADLVITTNQYNQSHLEQAYGVRALVVRLGVDLKLFKPGIKTIKREYYLFVGERDDLHGYPLIEELGKLTQHRIKLKLVSFKEGKYTLSEADLIKTYQQAIATICLDRMEPFGLIPLESMACGTPVIAVNEGGYRETVRDGQTGFLVERSAEAVYHKILFLAQNKEQYQEISENCRHFMVENFGIKNHLKALEAVLMGRGER